MLSDLTKVNRFDQRGSPCLAGRLIFHNPNRFRTQTKGDRRPDGYARIMRRSDKESAIAKIDLQHFVSARDVTGQKIAFADELCNEPVARVTDRFPPECPT